MPNQAHVAKSKLNNILNSKNLLTTRSATVTDGGTQYIYVGSADPGSLESDQVWLIQRTAINGDDTTATLFANGKVAFDQIWSDRATLTYG